MFAKPQKTSGNSLLKNKDVKKFRKDVSIRFGGSNAFSDEQLQSLVPNKATIKKQSFQAPSRMVVYVNEDTHEPIAFDAQGKGDELCFSLYALWKMQELLPRLEVHAPVSEFVLRGADVMLPGVVFTSLEQVQALRKGELRALYARGNPHAFAVGEMLVDAREIEKHGKTGKAMAVLHYYGDELWKMGPQTCPNEGFPSLLQVGNAGAGKAKPVVKPIDGGVAVESDGDGDDDEEEEDAAGVDVGGITLEEVQVDEELEEKAPATVATAQEDGEDGEEEEEVQMTKEEMDALYHQSLLQVIRSRRIKDKQLPMLANMFYATHLLPCRPAGTTLHIKQTTYKKTSVFLKAMAAKGLLAVREKDGVQSITAIGGARDPDVVEHELYRTAEDEKRDEDAAALLSGAGGRTAPPPGTYAPDVQEFLGLSQQLKKLLTRDQELAVHFQDLVTTKKYFLPVEVRDLVNKYIDLAQLGDQTDKKYVKLNGPLTDTLFTGGKQPMGGYPDRMARPDLYAILLDKCTKYHRVSLFPGHEPRILGGEVKKIEICANLSKKHKSSTVTSLSFYQNFGIDGLVFAKEVQKKWGCSASLQPSEDKAKVEEIHVQGQLVNEVLLYLESKYKIATAKYCTVTYGKNVKPKKK